MPRVIDNLVHQINRNDEHSTSMNRPSVVSLKEIVEQHAHRWYKENEKDSMKARWGRTYNWKELTKEIDWRSLKVRHEPIVYHDIDKPGTPKNHILFRSTFLNDTNREQEYRLSAQRRTTSTCSISISEGYTTEVAGSLELEIPLPVCVAEVSTGFRHEYTLEQSKDKQVEEELTWSVESNIKIPILSQTTAELIVQEDHYHGRFEIQTYFYGQIRIKIYKDSQELLLLEFSDLEDIFTREKGFRKDQRGIYRFTYGECRARFGVSQRVELRSKPLSITPIFQNQERQRNNIPQIQTSSAPNGTDL